MPRIIKEVSERDYNKAQSLVEYVRGHQINVLGIFTNTSAKAIGLKEIYGYKNLKVAGGKKSIDELCKEISIDHIEQARIGKAFKERYDRAKSMIKIYEESLGTKLDIPKLVKSCLKQDMENRGYSGVDENGNDRWIEIDP